MYFTTKLCCIFLCTYEGTFCQIILLHILSFLSPTPPSPLVFFFFATIQVELPQPRLEPMPPALEAWSLFFFLIFLCGWFLNSLWNLLQYSCCVIFWEFFWPWGMWDLSYPTRDKTHTPHIGRLSLSHWTTKEVPHLVFLKFCLQELRQDTHCV